MKRLMAGILLFMIMLVGSGFSCSSDKRSSFEKGFAASVRVSAMGESAGKSVIKAYHDGVIDLATKNKIFDQLGKISVAGREFHNILAGLVERYPDGVVPASEMQPLQVLFNEQIYGPLMDILDLAGVLTASQKEMVELAMQGLKLAILTIRGSMFKLTGQMPVAGGGAYV